MKARLLRAISSPVFLPETATLRRQPEHPRRKRQQAFYDAFEARALVYDAFWHADGERILLVCPPPLNLRPHLEKAEFTAMPGEVRLKSGVHVSRSVMIISLTGAPRGTEVIGIKLGELSFALPVQANASEDMRDRRVVFTMSKDNDLAWIREWAGYHAKTQGADAVVFFDNGSTRYKKAEIEEALLSVPGLAAVAVQSWPYKYGSPDPAIRNNPFYTLFLQIASMSVALRRYAAHAKGLLNCDIDELVATPEGTTIFDLAEKSAKGLFVMEGQFIEAMPAHKAPLGTLTHRHFPYRRRDPKPRRSAPRKWALDPRRDWVQSLDVHPYMHWIHGRPWFGKSSRKDVFYWHFRGINTNWKEDRTAAGHLSLPDLEPDPRLSTVHWPPLTQVTKAD